MRKAFRTYSHVVTVALFPLLLVTNTIQASTSANGSDIARNELTDEAGSTSAGNDQRAYGPRDADGWTFVVYPILAWTPIFGASVDLPNVPSTPGGGTSISGSGSTDVSLNGAALAGFEVQHHKWTLNVDALWAGLSADRTTPRVHISTNAIYGDLFIGHQIYHHVALTGGVRRMALRVHAQLGDLPEAYWKPGVWDPMVGMDWRQALGRKWTFRLNLAGGGFGVGNDVDLSASSKADWQFARHFGLTMGYGALHFQNSTTVLNQVRKTKQTLHGPIVGFGIYF